MTEISNRQVVQRAVVAGLIIAFVILAGWYFSFLNYQKPSVSKIDSRIATDDTVLADYISAYGPEDTIAFIKTLPVDCHQRVHKVGRTTYELRGTDAFKVMNSECQSGYTHGMTEAFFRENGADNLTDKLKVICQDESNPFYAHQCFHGIGHGLMAFYDYGLFDALKGCDTLPSNKESCYSGAFMENVVGALSVEKAKAQTNSEYHATEYLKDDDAEYPCNIVDDIYKSTCYFFQTSRMLQIFGPDFDKIAGVCGGLDVKYQAVCFSSMGRDVSNTNGDGFKAIVSACNEAEAIGNQTSCIDGAAQDRFWHESETDEAFAFCQYLHEEPHKTVCYRTLDQRASEIVSQPSSSFCSHFESNYRYLCRWDNG